MDQVGIQQVQNVQQPTFQGRKAVEYETASNPYEQKKDGDKKLMGALIGLGATAAAGIYIAKGKGKLPTSIRNRIGKIFGKTAKEAAEKANSTVSKSALKEAGVQITQDGKWAKNSAGQFLFTDGTVLGTAKKPFRVNSQNGKGWIEYVDGRISQACDGQVIKKYSQKGTDIYDLNGKLLKRIHKGKNGITEFYEFAEGQNKGTLTKLVRRDGNKTTIETNFSRPKNNRIAGHVESFTDIEGKKVAGKGTEITRNIEITDRKDGSETINKTAKTFFSKR